MAGFRIPKRSEMIKVKNADYLSTNDAMQIYQKTGIDPFLALTTHGYAVLRALLAWWHVTNDLRGEWAGITWDELSDTWPPAVVELYGPDDDATDIVEAVADLEHADADADANSPEVAMPPFTEASGPESA